MIVQTVLIDSLTKRSMLLTKIYRSLSFRCCRLDDSHHHLAVVVAAVVVVNVVVLCRTEKPHPRLFCYRWSSPQSGLCSGTS